MSGGNLAPIRIPKGLQVPGHKVYQAVQDVLHPPFSRASRYTVWVYIEMCMYKSLGYSFQCIGVSCFRGPRPWAAFRVLRFPHIE